MRAGANRRTVYDVMEDSGIFRRNPANADSLADNGDPLYQGPVEYPKMLYHPKGEERVLVPGEMLLTRDGQPLINHRTQQPVIVGEQKEIIWKMVETPEEEAELVTEGWHTHPALAIAAANDGRPVPPMGNATRLTTMTKDLADKEAELEALKKRLIDLGEDV